MPMLDITAEYGSVSRFNHWLGAIIVITMLSIGLYMHELPRGDDRTLWYGIHISIGVLTFVLIAFRVFWRIISRTPEAAPQPAIWRRAASLMHLLLLVGITIMFISGPLLVWTGGRPLSPFGLFSLPSPFSGMGDLHDLHEWLEEAHAITARVLLVLISIHIVAVLKHLLFSPAILRGRMWGRRF
ncbi:MAG: cytochrome b [Wenzhouxiangellaceae bacterium]